MNQLALLSEIKKPSQIDDAVVLSFGEDEDCAVKSAILYCWNHRRIQRMSQRRAAELCGMSASHFSNILNGDKYLPPQKINQFEWLTGSTCITQTLHRFAKVRERETVQQMASVIAEHMVAA